jgi:hypothetical protein
MTATQNIAARTKEEPPSQGGDVEAGGDGEERHYGKEGPLEENPGIHVYG